MEAEAGTEAKKKKKDGGLISHGTRTPPPPPHVLQTLASCPKKWVMGIRLMITRLLQQSNAFQGGSLGLGFRRSSVGDVMAPPTSESLEILWLCDLLLVGPEVGDSSRCIRKTVAFIGDALIDSPQTGSDLKVKGGLMRGVEILVVLTPAVILDTGSPAGQKQFKERSCQTQSVCCVMSISDQLFM